MRALLSISTLSIVSLVAALGCATTQQESAPQTPAAVIAPAPELVVASPMHRASRLEDHVRPAAPPAGPVSLTGQLTYGERYDSSGWSGTSIPKAMGGGPVESVDDPYNGDGSAPANGNGTTEGLAPENAPPSDASKNLQTNDSTK